MTKSTYSLQVRPNELSYFFHLYIFISTTLERTVRIKNKNNSTKFQICFVFTRVL
ncbi:hypothetical protein RO3G_07546 [Rhizopus delemar RA 99-880]|uniref:Uncharacterized protein n=1 Tax=Rhizopus delemar (strain RA 99-880 / ATCC MYA-4621 / FGSC 9543 / NRRL 43880) TaxID=246409 RepID=I1C311_RHIO9|nr:hypothetical protein RO3G_07546 [Rhizopus delemar RA 99-880]|eukprot:EIE82841.1 hypothetical protein RO3G_07546 [Rhizopus delemar RA 99-880]